MRKSLKISINDIKSFKKSLIDYVSKTESGLILDSSDYYQGHTNPFDYHDLEFVAAIGIIDEIEKEPNDPFDSLKKLHDNHKDWLFGHFSYDLKNKIEKLSSNNTDNIEFPDIYFFVPRWVIVVKKNEAIILFTKNDSDNDAQALIEKIIALEKIHESEERITLKSRFSKEEYIKSVEEIKKHIQNGDIYEMNFCQEFFAENCNLNPNNAYSNLSQISPAPFSAFYRLSDKFLISSSPERYLKKKGANIVSQPIKGTIKRGINDKEDLFLKETLKSDTKEQSENVMIVDLVRNDLSRTAKTGTVKVLELCGIYEFPQVFQMISTIESELSSDKHFVDVIRNSFPMGSMTGAPKIRAMEIIEDFEKTKRGLYSGSVGYISPEGDFDFNVIIRSLQYNRTKKYLSYIVGGAITIKSLPEKEYDECMLKAKALKKVIEG